MTGIAGWQNVDPVDLMPDDVVLSRRGPARVWGWRWRPLEGTTIDVEVIATGETLQMREERVLRAVLLPAPTLTPR